ncbi:MAG: GNAT family N-acetyltransferase [Methylophilaceae bacterium]
MRLVEITDDGGGIVEPLWLIRAEMVHRQLRPQLPLDYLGRMHQVFANGARLMVVVDNERVLGLGLWRLIENTYEGRRLYVDDLVTDESTRSQGVGKLLLQHLEQQARTLGCEVLALDSGVQRVEAHKFYFREGMHIRSFCFRKTL